MDERRGTRIFGVYFGLMAVWCGVISKLHGAYFRGPSEVAIRVAMVTGVGEESSHGEMKRRSPGVGMVAARCGLKRKYVTSYDRRRFFVWACNDGLESWSLDGWMYYYIRTH